MNKPSPNLADLNKQIQNREQELHTLQTILEATENLWVDQKKQIAKDTEVTIKASRKAISDATKEAKKKLSHIEEEVEAAEQRYEVITTQEFKDVTDIKGKLEDLSREEKVLAQTNADLNLENTKLSSAVKVVSEELEQLKETEAASKEHLEELSKAQEALDGLAESIKTKLQTLVDDLETANTEFTETKSQLDRDISVLELKKQDQAQEILENRARDDRVRENLADWQSKLDEKDKNLRIREAKVNDKEKSLARNYNLLNM